MTPKRILIVEDEAVVQLHLRRVVEGLGYVVVGVAATSAEAFKLAAKHNPELVLMDIRLHGGDDGVETARELKSRFSLAVVFLTAYADEETVARTRDAGAVGYIIKPFTPPEVRAVLSTALAEHERYGRVESSESSLRNILGTLTEGIIVVDKEGTITFFNPSAGSLTGLNPDEAVGRDFRGALRFVSEATAFEQAVSRSFDRRCTESFSALGLAVRGRANQLVNGEVEYLADVGTGPGLLIVLRGQSEYGRDADAWIPHLRHEISSDGVFHGLVGESEPMLRLFAQIQELSRVDWTVLIEGETGTGKELVGRAIHSVSDRKEQRFVAVNCAGLTDSLLGSQLFGHKRGAFTGAVDDQPGVFEAADKGTLFLDEIGDVSPVVQRSLLRIIEDKQVTRLGESKPHAVDTRLVAATQRDLAAEVNASNFRADLLFRLRVARIKLPPLRDRIEDIPRLSAFFLSSATRAAGKTVRHLSDAVMHRLTNYAWPGNVRELRSALAFAVLSCKSDTIRVDDLPPEIIGEGTTAPPPVPDPRQRVLDALARTGGNRTRAARLLGISRATLYRRLAELGIADD